ncbi:MULTISPECIES: MraY family glycosyltransferase [Pseudomonas]|uniref:MraY family glycosyltransferase n=1 Tax=Pseudomonas TaxID=286 RepID=UPI0002A159C3|nr:MULTISPECIES: glycosyltransferase family 4 protein [Pseudomonas]AGA72312.1 glycosyl transferase family protein [Pseudomonas putida HB3267]MCE0755272.1 glycosyltransferase family 4 protein [Pseudomonas asiatica]MCE0946733.1 glycosyltransferase family 4 protein [Pseudomonas asiatica]MCE0955918.1 glycosyltransferase family 4 protein [Pseudomonas asiatica]MCE1032244.1 glycosyltransferase family 4 protein [Pseudomonas asiatica]
MMLLWFLPAILIMSLVMTAGLRRYALARSVIDVPNARSSHTVPTPRGGGVAIVLTFLLAMVGLMLSGAEQIRILLALGGAGALIAVIGFMDDHGHIAARWRLLGHFIAAAWMLGWLGGLPPLLLFGWTLDLGWLGGALAAFYLVWLLNLYNFMDGIDGIASIEAITACLGAAWLYWLGGLSGAAMLPLLLAAAVAGFLYWNFPPAKIFMGDAGSGFIGIVLGGLSLQAAWVSPPMFWCWLILLGVFIVDATYTLVRRSLRGDKVYEAHRSHAYQFASRKYGKHLPVTLTVAVLNLCWLLPVAYCVVQFGLDGALGVVIAYVPLVALAVRYRAGDLEDQR